MKKAYIATVEVEFIVVGKDEDEALEVAQNSVKEVINDIPYYELLDSYCIKEATYYPDSWDENCLPYGTKNDVPVGHFMNQTPAYQKSKERLIKVKEILILKENKE